MAKWKWYSASGILIGDRINVFEENEEGNPERFPLEFLGQMKRFPLLGGPAAAEALMWGVQ